MGDLGADTAVVDLDDGRFSARLSPDWEIWGPMGGYVAAVALRAAGAAGGVGRPASFACHYLGVAAFDEVEVTVTTLRAARTACSQRVEVAQAGKPILEATVWSTGDVDGLAHDVTEAPDAPGPDELPSLAEVLTEEERRAGLPYPFWRNLDIKPLDPESWRRPPDGSPEPLEPMEPVWRTWCRFVPTATFDDPWVDACRSLILLDVQPWPAAARQHRSAPRRFIAPSLDLYVAFHRPRPDSPWLLADGYAPVAADGLVGWNGRLWSADRRLVASAAGQLLCRRLPG